MKRFIITLVAILALLGVAVQPASAAWNACPDNRFCMWSNSNYWGTTAFTNPVRNVCYPADTWVSSVRNTTDDHVHIYVASQCGGTGYDLYPGQSSPNMVGFGGDNNMRSYRVT